MLTRKMNLATCAFLVSAMMTAGCANQEVVKKDEGIAPPPVAKQTAQTAAPVTTPPKQPGTSTARQEVAPQAPTVQQPPAANPAEVQLQSQLETVYFDFDSSNLSESASSKLSKNASALKKEPTAKIRIEGNCDERGSAEYNLALGERRARSAQQYLTTLGIEPDRLSIISYGKEKPAVQGNDEAAWAKNRRDDFVVTAP